MSAKRFMAFPAAAALAFGLAACGGGGGGAEEDGGEDTGASPEMTEESPMETDGTEMAMDQPFGPACADVPTEGEGSVEGMADDPVATAASNNPLLSTLVDAVTQADLVDTLNDAEDITVFAPANAAFEEIPEEDLNALLEDQDQLTEVLTYHVVEGRHGPSDLEDGTFTSLQGEEVTTSGSGEEFTVNDEAASVVCGNVQTANATVYVIDGVLMPGD
ncbi:putative surface protein with fasciclin (FAS1) repeats [Spinactinospora alkalitolerans]|uniref:Putative surface protein with fasciclin (FAS1) repeats n=1 Tax=Spinactinospora alkalitolerans TaxID=687207 RepID=A0A852TSE8_9ACTN|nr:fasciclin domain-containing protein [Spinactinospora alkalitolerans]NYE47326.1 putative surface protein with fasciclin (FAS1) repeats [Spinactinospora alkalitolerans]